MKQPERITEQMAYMLNSLWTEHYELGRIVRFRHVVRGRQATCFEVLTAEQREFTAYLFPGAFAAEQLARVCQAIGAIDRERFSVMPMIATRDGGWSITGPQGTQMVVGMNPSGQGVVSSEWTTHDVSQLGLRLAWLHRLLPEHWMLPAEEMGLDDALETALAREDKAGRGPRPAIDLGAVGRLQESLSEAPPPPASGWCHGDVHPGAMLMNEDHQISAVVDWGLLHAGDPLEDIVDAFVHWCIGEDGVINEGAGRALIESYRTLRTVAPGSWGGAVQRWCAQRIIDALGGRRELPAHFAGYLAESGALSRSLELCEA